MPETASPPPPPQRRVRLHFTVEYDGSLLAPRPREYAPVLMTWASARRGDALPRAKRYFPVTWADDALTRSAPIAAHIDFACSVDADGGVARTDSDMTVGLRVKAHQPNDHGDVSLQNCGDALLPLGQLLREAHAAERGAAGAWRSVAARKLPLKLRFPVFADANGERVVKGAAVVSGLRVTLLDDDGDGGAEVALGVPVDASGELEPLDEFAYVPHNEPLFAATIQNAMVRNIMLFTDQAAQQNIEFKASTAEAQRIHAPFFQTPAGLLPGFAYMLKPGPAAPSAADADGGAQFGLVRAWLAQNLRYALLRANRSAEWFADAIEQQLARDGAEYDDERVPECCEILGQMLVIAPTSMPYVSDTVSTAARGKLERLNTLRGRVAFERSEDGSGVHAVERFSEMADNDGGDCEDGGTFAYRVAITLAGGEWSTAANDADGSFSALAAAAALARQYVPMVNLGSVRAAAVGNDLTDDSKLARDADIIDSYVDRKRTYGAHMWGQMQPLVRFVAAVRRAVPDARTELLWLRGASGAPWTAALPTLVLEATGRLAALQLPAAAYIVHDDAQNSRRAAAVRSAEQHKQLVRTLLTSTATLRRMTMVRGQQETRNVPNKRINHFYRQTTHSFTAALLPNGVSTLDYVNVQCGGRVPAPTASTPAKQLFADNPLSAALKAPVAPAQTPVIGQRRPDNPSRGESDDERSGGGDDDFGDADADSDSDSGADTDSESERRRLRRKDKPSPTRSVDRALELVGAPAERALHAKSGATLLATHTGGAVGRLQYGVPMYDNLQTPLLPATALAPSTPLTGREVRVIAELLRHSPPISTPGDWRDIELMHAARLESLRANTGVDVAAHESAQYEALSELRRAVRRAMGTLQADGSARREWPTKASSKWHLVTFVFDATELEASGAVDAIGSDVRALAGSGLVRYARTSFEEPMPHRRSAVLQFLCDSTKI